MQENQDDFRRLFSYIIVFYTAKRHMRSIVLPSPSMDERVKEIIGSKEWRVLEVIFKKSTRISFFGNGGNLAVADHAAIDLSRLTNKLGLCPGSGILASSLINDKGHDEWLKKWVEITARGLTKEVMQNSLFIGISSSGKSENVIAALNYAQILGGKSFLITASSIKSLQKITFDYINLGLDQYHNAEVVTLLLTYQLIESAGFSCPTITESSKASAEKFDFK